MNKIIRQVKRLVRTIIIIKERIHNSFVVLYYKRDIDSSKMIFTSRNGEDIAGNMLRLIIEAYNRDEKFNIGIAATNEKRDHIKRVLNRYGLRNVTVVKYDSINYYKWIETSKYLFCDSTLPRSFIKKRGHIYINTWHGSPLKRMGNDSKSDRYDVANVQKNLLSTDLLICPSDYYGRKMTEAYDIQNLYTGHLTNMGYPRNSIFYDSNSRKKVRKRYGLNNKNVYIYMPTYRESMGVKQNTHQVSQLKEFFDVLDKELHDDEVLYVKLHVFNAEHIDFKEYVNIKEFPNDIETYEFLNATDALISDYSSVMYDYANTRNLIVRFVYDESLYFSSRGMYKQPVEMPFPKVYKVSQLMDTVRLGKQYDDSLFLDTFCKYDNEESAKLIFDAILDMSPNDSIQLDSQINYYYNEQIPDNFITDNLDKILCDNTNERAFLSFSKQALRRRPINYDNISSYVDGVIGINNTFYKTVSETIAYYLLNKYGKYNDWIERKLDEHYIRECRRLFAGFPFSTYTFYQGKNINTAGLLSMTEAKNTLYVYYYWMDRYNPAVLKRLFVKYDEIVVCDKEMIDRIKDIMGSTFDSKKIRVNKYYI